MFSRAEMKRFNINLFTPSHKNSGIFDLHYAHIFLAVLWNKTKERRRRISTRGWLGLPALKRCTGLTNSSSQGSNQAVFICVCVIWAAKSLGFQIACQLFTGTLKKKKTHQEKNANTNKKIHQEPEPQRQICEPWLRKKERRKKQLRGLRKRSHLLFRSSLMTRRCKHINKLRSQTPAATCTVHCSI